MLVGKVIMNRIDDIVERAYLGFMFDVVGDDFFTEDQKRKIESLGLIIGRRPLIELLYILIRNRPTEGYRKDKTLGQLLDEVALSGILPVFSDTQQYSLDHAKAAIGQALDNTKQSLKKRVKQAILQANDDYKKDVEINRALPVPQQASRVKDYMGLLSIAVAALAPVIAKEFDAAFTSELTDSINDAVVDRISQDAMFENLPAAETLVYKDVVNDGSLCQWCQKFYVNKDGTPKVYKLSELQANGSNTNKKKSEWLPTVGATHPRCRCQLQKLARKPK